jgi:hypothetical protein
MKCKSGLSIIGGGGREEEDLSTGIAGFISEPGAYWHTWKSIAMTTPMVGVLAQVAERRLVARTYVL